MILLGFFLILIAAILAVIQDRLPYGESPLGNIKWAIKLAKIFGIICIIFGFLLILAALAAIPLILIAAIPI